MKLKDVKGIGTKTLEILNQNGITTIKDLIYYFPKSYEIYEENINSFNAGEKTIISGVLVTNPVFAKYNIKTSITIFYIRYNNRKLKCVLFSTDYLRYRLHLNNKVYLYGRYKKEKNEFIIDKVIFKDDLSFCKPIYKIDGLLDSKVTNILEEIFKNRIITNETLPTDLIDKYKLLTTEELIYKAHFPKTVEDIRQVDRRKKYEEFFWYLIRLAYIKDLRISENKEKRNLDVELIKKFLTSIPFELTKDQLNVLSEIKNDVSSDKVMNRLIQGDVSCGKSIVSFIFALMLMSSGYQVALMVPSEFLAKQQYTEAKSYFEKFGFIVELLTSKIKTSDKEDIIERIASGRVNFIIGTHSLLNSKIRYKNLGGIIIDEQHRFGVEQRKYLLNNYEGVDALYLSATPIPRSLGLSYFGDLDISSIHMMPQGRKKIETISLNYQQINKLFTKIKEELALKHQVYVVVPKVEEGISDKIYIEKCHQLFKANLPNVRIGITHGKLKNTEKMGIMDKFYNHNLDILISTTVIEVGINVKNATVMAIMDAERFGLAELHQLRGRVGRGEAASYCFLVSEERDNPRIDIIVKENDGFNISEADFLLRGPGDYIGNIQSGFDNLEYASFQNDFKIWKCAKEDADIYFQRFKNGELKSKIYDDIIKIKNVGNIS